MADEIGLGAKGDGFASAGWGLQVSGEETDRELTALPEAAGFEIEADGDGSEADADLSLAKFYGRAVGALAQLRGAESEGVA